MEPGKQARWPIAATHLRRLRLERGMSQAQLALRSGVRQQHISNMERQDTQAGLGTVLRLAGALGVGVAALLTGGALELAERLAPAGDAVAARAAAGRVAALLNLANQMDSLVERLAAEVDAVRAEIQAIQAEVAALAPPATPTVGDDDGSERAV